MTDRKRSRPDDYFKDWKDREALAEAMIPLVGKLIRENSVKTYIYGKSLVNQSVLDIMQDHRYVRTVEQNELSEKETYPVIKALAELDLGTAHIDVGRIAVGYEQSGRGQGLGVDEYVREQVADLIGSNAKPIDRPRDVVLYGFGRIGRLMARLLVEKAGGGDTLRLRAVVVRRGRATNDLEKRITLLQRDSVHGPFNGTIRIDEERGSFVANGNEVHGDPRRRGPTQIDYSQVRHRRRHRGRQHRPCGATRESLSRASAGAGCASKVHAHRARQGRHRRTWCTASTTR